MASIQHEHIMQWTTKTECNIYNVYNYNSNKAYACDCLRVCVEELLYSHIILNDSVTFFKNIYPAVNPKESLYAVVVVILLPLYVADDGAATRF